MADPLMQGTVGGLDPFTLAGFAGLGEQPDARLRQLPVRFRFREADGAGVAADVILDGATDPDRGVG